MFLIFCGSCCIYFDSIYYDVIKEITKIIGSGSAAEWMNENNPLKNLKKASFSLHENQAQ